MRTEQDDTNTTGPIHTFVAALPPHVKRAFHANSNSIPQLRFLAEQGVDLKALAHAVSGGLKYNTAADRQRIVTHRVQVAAERAAKAANPSTETEDSSS